MGIEQIHPNDISPQTTFAMFGVHGEFSSPDELTDLIGIKPSLCFGKGEVFVGHISRDERAERERSTGNWSLYSVPAIDSEYPNEHIEHLLDLLEPMMGRITDWRGTKAISVQLWIRYAMPEGGFGYTLPAELLRRMSDICDQVNIAQCEYPCDD